MGLLRDAVDLGYINESQYNDLAEQFFGYHPDEYGNPYGQGGSDLRHEANVEILQEITDTFAALGYTDLADQAFSDYQAAVETYVDKYDGSITYDSNLKKWRSTETGRFVADPYEWLED